MEIQRFPKVKGYSAPQLTLFEISIDETWPKFEDARIAATAWATSLIARRKGDMAEVQTLQRSIEEILESNRERRTCSFSVNMELRELFQEHGLAV